jgi:[protein-PII] uridylyltransferase
VARKRVFNTQFRSAKPTGLMDPARPSCAPRPWRCASGTLKYEDTPYSLEPNCKESPGGLRDLQMVIWVARAAGLGRTWRRAGGQGPDHAVRGEAAAAQ